MSLDLRELYQEIIVEHNRNPHNHYVMEDATAQADGFNPLCGDKLTLYLKIEDNRLKELSFCGRGCAISQASASLMTDALRGKTLLEAELLFERFHALLTNENDSQLSSDHGLDRLEALAGVKAYPARVKCATLAWHTFNAAVQCNAAIVSTE